MPRLTPLPLDELSPEQQRLHAEILGPRGNVGGPFGVWLRVPRIADAANRFGNAIRAQGTLDKRLMELAVLVIARHWSAQYEWHVHENAALEAGLSGYVIEAIRHHRTPAFAREDERLIYDIVTEMHATRTLGQASYDRAVAALGLEKFIELVTVIGFYTTAAMMINAFDAPVPDGTRPLP